MIAPPPEVSLRQVSMSFRRTVENEVEMATNSPIEWTDATWNPVTGCDKISPGCKHCYAERMAIMETGSN
jgi:DNA repair photolyase